MTRTPETCAYVRGICDALEALTDLCRLPLDEMGEHPLADLTTWEVGQAFREAVVSACRRRIGRVPLAVRRAGR